MVSPDNQYLVFLGKDGYMVLVSNKVNLTPSRATEVSMSIGASL